jgi:hypothetical protein
MAERERRADLPAPQVPTSQTWPPSRARRAAIGWLGGHAYFFKGGQYVRYTLGSGVDAGYPNGISAFSPELAAL